MTRIEEWGRRYLVPMADRKHDFGSWSCGVGGNQSLAGLAQRWLTCDPVLTGHDSVGVMSESRVTPETLNAVTWDTMFLFLIGGLACSWKASAASAPTGATSSPTGVELGMVVLLMLLLSPHSSKPHFCTLLLPGFCMVRAALNWPNRQLLLRFLAALTCELANNYDLVGWWLYSWSKWHATPAWCAALVCGVVPSVAGKSPRCWCGPPVSSCLVWSIGMCCTSQFLDGMNLTSANLLYDLRRTLHKNSDARQTQRE